MLQLKTNKLFLAWVCSFSILSIASSEKQTDEINKHNWNTFNDVFIKPSQLQAQTAANKAIKTLCPLALGTTFWLNLAHYIGGISTIQHNITPAGDITEIKGLFLGKKRLILSAWLSFYVTRYAFRKINEWVLAKEEQKELKKYIENWETNEKDTPYQLRTLLNNTYLKYKENPNEVDFAETARIVKAFVNNQNVKDFENSDSEA